jgi:hypothetical protein
MVATVVESDIPVFNLDIKMKGIHVSAVFLKGLNIYITKEQYNNIVWTWLTSMTDEDFDQAYPLFCESLFE